MLRTSRLMFAELRGGGTLHIIRLRRQIPWNGRGLDRVVLLMYGFVLLLLRHSWEASKTSRHASILLTRLLSCVRSQLRYGTATFANGRICSCPFVCLICINLISGRPPCLSPDQIVCMSTVRLYDGVFRLLHCQIHAIPDRNRPFFLLKQDRNHGK